MQLPPLTRGRIVSRYKRFLADVELPDGSLVTAHCPNTGRMTGCWRPGAPVEVSYSDNPRRKLPWTLERVDMGLGWVGVNTARVNAVVAEAIEEGRIPSIGGYSELRREVRVQRLGHPPSRLDLSLTGGGGADVLVEVKCATLWDGERLRFPDAVSERGRKHVELLRTLAGEGLRAVLVFAVNRPEGDCFSPAWEIDPDYSRALAVAAGEGVEVLALRIEHHARAMLGGDLLRVDLHG
ncbi:MAG: DNA/RNA nuclease SfsA [Candidatus Sedimenticola endophacoides]